MQNILKICTSGKKNKKTRLLFFRVRNNEPTWLKGSVRFTNFHGVIVKGDVSVGKVCRVNEGKRLPLLWRGNDVAERRLKEHVTGVNPGQRDDRCTQNSLFSTCNTVSGESISWTQSSCSL